MCRAAHCNLPPVVNVRNRPGDGCDVPRGTLRGGAGIAAFAAGFGAGRVQNGCRIAGLLAEGGGGHGVGGMRGT